MTRVTNAALLRVGFRRKTMPAISTIELADRAAARTRTARLAVVFLLLALECVPFWIFPWFPNQDGPSHLYNALVLADYGKAAVYREYYTSHFSTAGNVLTQLLLIGLLKMTGDPFLAEKLLLSVYALSLPLCLWYLLRSLSSQALTFSLFAFLLIPNFFLHMGFWNFCVGIPLVLFALGYYAKHRQAWSFRSIAVFGMLGATLYLAHIVAWVVFAIAVVICEFADAWPIAIMHTSAGLWRGIISSRRALALSTLLPPGVFSLVYALTTQSHRQVRAPAAEPLMLRAWHVYSFSFLRTLSEADVVFLKAIAALSVLMVMAALVLRLRWARLLRPTDAYIVVGGICSLLAVFGPDAVGDGSYIRGRVALFAWVFLVVWLAAQEWTTWMTRAIWVLVPAIAALSMLARLPEYRRWNGVLQELQGTGAQIRPGRTVLGLRTQRGVAPDPLFHAVDWFVPRPLIDLRNYEASTDHFLTRFRPERSPFDALGKLMDLQQAPAVFDIPRYEAQTHGCVDYVLLYGLPKFAEGAQEAEQDYRASLHGYRLISVSAADLKLQLYERSQPCGSGSQ